MSKKITRRELKHFKPQNTTTNKLIKKILFSLISIILIVSIGLGISVFYENQGDKELYVTSGDVEFTETDFLFYYIYSVNNFLYVYKDNLDDIGLDKTKDFSKQIYDAETNETWFDYFCELTNAMVQSSNMLYEESKKAKFKPTGEVYDTFMADIKKQAEEENRSYKNYLTKTFSEKMTPKAFEKQLERYCTAIEYSNYLKEQYKKNISDDELLKYYNSNTKYYDSVDYLVFNIAYDKDAESDDEENGVLTKDSAYLRAQNVSKATSQEDFKQLVIDNAPSVYKDVYASNDIVTASTTSIITAPSDYSDWLYNDDRKAGDTTIIEGTDTLTVIYFVNRARNDEPTVSFKTIMLTTDKYKDNLEKTINAMYDKIKSEGATEKVFDKYIESYSEDTAKNGLYSHVGKKSIPSEFTDWLFDDTRKAGDTTIINLGESAFIIYFVSNDNPYWTYSAKDDYADEKYEEFTNSKLGEYTLKFVNGSEYNALTEHQDVSDTLIDTPK